MTHLWGIRGTYDLAVLWGTAFAHSYRDGRRVYRCHRLGAAHYAFWDACHDVWAGLALRRAHGTPEEPR